MGIDRAALPIRIWCALALALLFVAAPSLAQEKSLKGIALVIGNGDYEHIARLPNPANDARAIEEMLDRLGFETTLVSDRNARRLRRDLEAFVDDAKDADVAVIYYSGHGIEAGGENFLIPVDADLSALSDAGEKLVPVGTVIDDLKASVPVTIVLLDACRTNPFPANAALTLAPGAKPLSVTAGGLALSRGAAPLAAASGGAETYGTVIGFAAEPGKVALDGPSGANSPYAAAILRHVDAIGGQEFGTVMRMVAEEVYLKTGGKQRPWINESLRRLLYFGAPEIRPSGAEGDILVERRTLLLTIAALPEAGRRQIETIAANDNVPMDALYGMLAALGTEMPNDPAQLDRLLRQQTTRVKAMLDEHDRLKSADPEIARLAALSDQAIREGALNTAIGLLGEAKQRIGALNKTVDAAEADIKRKRLEFAALYAKSAEANALAFGFLAAADDLAQAFEQVEKWDRQLAWTYRKSEAEALISLGNFRGDKQALARAIRVGEDLVLLARDFAMPDRASSQLMLGNALQAMGERESGTEHIDRSIQAYKAALAGITPESQPLVWAKAQNNLANSLSTRSRRTGDRQSLNEAAEAYRDAVSRFEAAGARQEWAIALNNFGKALMEAGDADPGIERFNEAGRAFEASLTETSRESQPMLWATIWNNLGNAYYGLGIRLGDRNVASGRFVQAAAAYNNALAEWTRERVPAQWAVAQGNLANAYRALAYAQRDPAMAMIHLKSAATALRAALEELTRERGPMQWATVSANLALLLQQTAEMDIDRARGSALLNEAAMHQRAVLDVYSPGEMGHLRAATLHDLAYTLIMIGDRGGGLESYRQAEAVYREEETLRSPETPLEWAKVQAGIGNALHAIGIVTRDRETLVEAERRTRLAWDTVRPIDTQYDGLLSGRLKEIETGLAGLK